MIFQWLKKRGRLNDQHRSLWLLSVSMKYPACSWCWNRGLIWRFGSQGRVIDDIHDRCVKLESPKVRVPREKTAGLSEDRVKSGVEVKTILSIIGKSSICFWFIQSRKSHCSNTSTLLSLQTPPGFPSKGFLTVIHQYDPYRRKTTGSAATWQCRSDRWHHVVAPQ